MLAVLVLGVAHASKSFKVDDRTALTVRWLRTQTGNLQMQCPDCDHDNTSGAWLCINCGAKLPREGQVAPDPEQGEESSADEPSRFEPAISENLRRLRERAQRPTRPGQRSGRRSPPTRVPQLSQSTILGLPWAFWAVVIFLFVVIAMVLSNLQ